MLGTCVSLLHKKRDTKTNVDKVKARQKPMVSHLWIVGCDVRMFIFKEKRRKLNAQSIKCLVLKYNDTKKGNKLLKKIINNVEICKDVVFDEEVLIQ